MKPLSPTDPQAQTVDQLSDDQLRGAFTVSRRRTSERWTEYRTEADRFRALRDEMARRNLTGREQAGAIP